MPLTCGHPLMKTSHHPKTNQQFLLAQEVKIPVIGAGHLQRKLQLAPILYPSSGHPLSSWIHVSCSGFGSSLTLPKENIIT